MKHNFLFSSLPLKRPRVVSIPYSGHFLPSFKLFLFLFPWLLFTTVEAATIQVGMFSGANTNMTFNSLTRTWAPTSTASDSQLDATLLGTSLEEVDVTISNSAGDITFNSGEFTYSASNARTLTLSAQGNVTVCQVGNTGSPVSYVIEATGNVFTPSSPLVTNGGSLTSSGVNFTINGSTLSTGGGAVTLNHTGTVTIGAGGMSTGGGAFSNMKGVFTVTGSPLVTTGGKFSHKGGDVTVGAGGVSTGGGGVEIESTGNITISGTGILTGSSLIPGGQFSSKGVNFSTGSGSVQTYGGSVTIDHTGTVIVGSMSTKGGSFSSKGSTLTFTEGGLTTVGGAVTFNQTGAVLINSSGVNTGGGAFRSEGAGSMTIQQGGLNVGTSAVVRIVHAGISASDLSIQGTNASAEILLHGGCNSIAVSQLNVNGTLNLVGNAITIGTIKGTSALNVNATAVTTITVNDSIQTQGGNVVMLALDKIDLKAKLTNSSNARSILTAGGNIELKSKTSIASGNDPGLSTGIGSGGILTQIANPSGSVSLTGTPVLGSGNIVLVTDPTFTVPFGPGATEVCNGIDDNCDGTIDEGLSCSSLPVRLVLFSAKKEEQTVLLEWTTSLENNSQRFDIERSTNAKSWTTLGNVKAADQSAQSIYYSYRDASPLPGVSYYRLKMVDHDGTFAHSPIRDVRADGNNPAILSYPNPSAERIEIQMPDWNKVKSVQLLNSQGQISYDSFSKPVSSININHLPAGIYLLRITLKEGTVLTHKIIRE